MARRVILTGCGKKKKEFANLSLIESAKFAFKDNKNYANNSSSVLRSLADPEVMREEHALKSQVQATVRKKERNPSHEGI